MEHTQPGPLHVGRYLDEGAPIPVTFGSLDEPGGVIADVYEAAYAPLFAAAPDQHAEILATIEGWEQREGESWRKYRLDPLTPWEQERLNAFRIVISKATK